MYEDLSFIVADNEAEDCLLRNIEQFNEMFNDARSWSEPKCQAMLTDEELQRYIDLIPGSNLGTRRRKVIALVKANPCLRTVNPDILYQRVSFFIWNYGDKTKKVHRKRKAPILKTLQKLQNQVSSNE